MKRVIILLVTALLVGFNTQIASADGGETVKKVSIQGKVTDKNTGEALAGVLVYIKEINRSTYTDLEGRFSIPEVTPGTWNISLSYISYDETCIPVSVSATEEVVIQLEN